MTSPAAPTALRIAVIGGGISGLGAAHRLARDHRVTLFEAADYVGGHTNTVDIAVDGVQCAVDTGFLVFNERTYPNLIGLFAELGVPCAASDMSFSVSVSPKDFEWCGTDLASLFAQPSNAWSPRFWSMLADIVRFNRQATALARSAESGTLGLQPLGDWLQAHRFGRTFRDGYLLPMAAAIWSCPAQTMLEFPVASFVRFCDNHGLLQIADRPRWFTVRGGARQYVERILSGLSDVRRSTPVRAVLRMPLDEQREGRHRVAVITDAGRETFDHVILACHSDQALALLADPSEEEQSILGAIAYQPNRAYLHADTRLMPRRHRAWAAWNYLSTSEPVAPGRATSAPQLPSVAVTYWLNRLQPLPVERPVLVTLNPLEPPREDLTWQAIDYAHPVFDQAAMAAQARLGDIQGQRHTWFAGAWTGYGFHEDGLKSGLAVAAALGSHRGTQDGPDALWSAAAA